MLMGKPLCRFEIDALLQRGDEAADSSLNIWMGGYRQAVVGCHVISFMGLRQRLRSAFTAPRTNRRRPNRGVGQAAFRLSGEAVDGFRDTWSDPLRPDTRCL